MLDALELYEALCVENSDSLQEAIATFETTMCRRTAAVTEEAMQLMEDMQSENNLQFMLDFFGTVS